MKGFFTAKRRVKQHMLEKVGLAEGTSDEDFEAEYAQYKNIVVSIRHVQGTMRSYALATKKQFQTAAALSLELGVFHRGTKSCDGAMALGRAHAELERVELPAFERLFNEEVINAADVLLWQVPEVQERVKQRKKLLLDCNSHQRKYEAAVKALAECQNGNGTTGGGLFRRAKTESEVAGEVATREVKLNHAEAAVAEATEWCLVQFRELLDKQEAGNILGGPMAAFLACQQKMLNAGAQKLERVRPFLPVADTYDETLEGYVAEFARQQPLGDIFVDVPNAYPAGGYGFDEESPVFGVQLSGACPAVILEAIDYLTEHGLDLEGLFRVSGNHEVVSELRERYNAGETNVFEQYECDPFDVAALVKRFLNELPVSLIPQEFYNRVLAATRARDEGESLALVIEQLPDAHINCLSPILKFLYRLAKRSDTNKMTSSVIATCLAPTVVRAPSDEAPAKVYEDMRYTIDAFRTLIEQAKRYETEQPALPPMSASRRGSGQTENRSENGRPPVPYSTPNKHMSMRPTAGQSSGKGLSMSKRLSMRRGSASPSAISLW